MTPWPLLVRLVSQMHTRVKFHAYVELVEAEVSEEELAFCQKMPERAAHPKHMEILPELPKTAGQVFKPIYAKRDYTHLQRGLADAGVDASAVSVMDDKSGLLHKCWCR